MYRYFIFKIIFSKRSSHIKNAIIGIAFSLVPLIFISNIADSMIKNIADRFIETSDYHLKVNNQDIKVIELLKNNTYIKDFYQEKNSVALLSFNKVNIPVKIRAIEDKLLKDDSNFKKYFDIIEGKFDINEDKSIVLSSSNAKKLKAKVGDTIKILTTKDFNNMSKGPPKILKFKVSGIVSSGYYDLDKLWVFISLDSAKRFFTAKNSSDFIGIKIEEPYKLNNKVVQVNQKKAELLYNNITKDIITFAKVNTWYNLEKGKYINFIESKEMIQFIVIFLIFVAVINLSSSMIMLIIEKEQEISFLRCLGLSKNKISLCFIIASFIITLLGIIIGVIIGLILSLYVNELIFVIENIINILFNKDIKILNPEIYLSKIDIEFNFSKILEYSLLMLILSVLASFIPSKKVQNLSPIDMLK